MTCAWLLIALLVGMLFALGALWQLGVFRQLDADIRRDRNDDDQEG